MLLHDTQQTLSKHQLTPRDLSPQSDQLQDTLTDNNPHPPYSLGGIGIAHMDM